MGLEAEFTRHPIEVGGDLGLLDKGVRPPWIRPLRKRVGCGLHVTGQAWIGMLMPGPTDRIGFVEDREAIESFSNQLAARRQPAWPGPDDGNAKGLNGLVVGHWRSSVDPTTMN
jgi:hypothetical protein